MNKVFLIGNICNDLELKDGNGYSMLKINLACDTTNSKGEKITEFVNCIAWNKTAETMSKYLEKGRKIAIEGNLRVNKVENKNGGSNEIYSVYISAFHFLDSVKKEQKSDMQIVQEVMNVPNISSNEYVVSDADLPF